MKYRPVMGHRKTPAHRHTMSKCRRFYFIVIMDCQFMIMAANLRMLGKSFFDKIPLGHMHTLQHKNPPILNEELEGMSMRMSPVKTSFFLLAGSRCYSVQR
jgi:hypothetical protein